MSQSFKKSRVLPKLSSSQVVADNRKYVDQRRKGEITSLKTKLPKFNSSIMGGIETNTILTISALSGAGKSTLAKCIRDSIASLNPNMNFKQYLFNFEINSFDCISKFISFVYD